MINTPKVDYGLFRAYALPQSCPTFAIRGAPSPLLAYAERAPSIILPTRASSVSEWFFWHCNHFIIQILRVVSLYFKIINRVRCIRNSLGPFPTSCSCRACLKYHSSTRAGSASEWFFWHCNHHDVGFCSPQQHHHIIMWQKCKHYVKTAPPTLIENW